MTPTRGFVVGAVQRGLGIRIQDLGLGRAVGFGSTVQGTAVQSLIGCTALEA